MGFLDGLRGKRSKLPEYRTIDGGHLAPYPDMTDEQLYNYEATFKVPKPTFARPPAPYNVPAQSSAMESHADAGVQHWIGAPSMRTSTADVEPQIQPKTGSGVWQEPQFGVPRDEALGSGLQRASENEPVDAPVQTLKPVTRKTADPADRDAGAAPQTLADSRLRRNAAFDAPRYTARPARTTETDNAPVPARIDFSKPVRTITTRQPVEILTTRARHPIYKVRAYIGNADVETVFTLDGRLSDGGPVFLENVPLQTQLFLNIYRPAGADAQYRITQHASQQEADAENAQVTLKRLRCIEIDLE